MSLDTISQILLLIQCLLAGVLGLLGFALLATLALRCWVRSTDGGE